LFKVEDARQHAILVKLRPSFMGRVVFLLFALDPPFRGRLGIGAQPNQLLKAPL
jgi:hypothetical protein